MAGRTKVRIAGALALLVVLALVVPPFINVNRYKARVAGAIGGALGRPVTVENVRLRLLPQAGFTLENFAVADDPSFSAEPILRAGEVNAALRLSSLWRGKLEIARLTLKEPSLNLVRRPDGQWNLEPVLARARQAPSAPTGKTSPEARPRFPYVEAESGRINLKLGQEKKVWALTDADFSLWLASEDEWRARLEARPVRSDANLGNVGRVRAEGSFRRGGASSATSLKINARLDDAQLGQLSTLIFGRDRGWCGQGSASLALAGSAARVAITAEAKVDGFHRYDITSRDSLQLAVVCSATLRVPEQRLQEVNCQMPARDGEVAVRGSVANLFGERNYNLDIAVRAVNTSYVVALARQMKRDLPDDLTGEGSLSAAFTAKTRDEGRVEWAGGGSAGRVVLRSRVLETPLEIGSVQFAVATPASAAGAKQRVARRSTKASDAPAPARLQVLPFTVALGAGQPARAQAWFSPTNYDFRLEGPAQLPRLLGLARAFGVPATNLPLTGSARLQLGGTGAWTGFGAPLVTGTAELQGVAAADVNGARSDLRLVTARARLSEDAFWLENFQASLADGSVTLTGWARRPRGCGDECQVEFGLAADRVNLSALGVALNPQAQQRPWYRRLAGSGGGQPARLSRLRAHGTITMAQLVMKDATAQNVSADLEIGDGALTLSGLSATLFGGTLHGELRADLTTPAPSYSLSGSLQRASMAQVSLAMRDNWATGTAGATFKLAASGWSFGELAASVSGSADFEWRDGVLRHVVLAPQPRNGAQAAAGGPLRIQLFRGRALVRSGVLSLQQTKMETPNGAYVVSGTASKGRELALTLLSNARSFTVEGTLDAPRVQARLTPATHNGAPE